MLKWILLPLLWLVAAFVAVVVFYRLWRGKPVVLRGRLKPTLIRMVVIILVTLGYGVDEASAQREPRDRGRRDTGTRSGTARESVPGLPGSLNTRSIQMWLQYNPTVIGTRSIGYAGYWAGFKQNFTKLQHTGKMPAGVKAKDYIHSRYLRPSLQKMVAADVDAILAKQRLPEVSADQLSAVLAEVEKYGLFDHWLIGYLWQKTADLRPDDAAKIIPKLHEHARITNTLIQARAKVKPIGLSPRAWSSKAGPRPAERLAAQTAMAEMLGACKVLFGRADLGTWQKDGVVLLKLSKDSPKVRLVSGTNAEDIEPGAELRIGRLDLLTAEGDKPIVLEHEWLGKIQLGAGKPNAVWDLARGLSPDARIVAQKAVRDAVLGDEKEAERLEQALPLVHNLLRDELRRTPNAEGAPRMRMILALFDDAVMPKLATFAPALPVGRGGRGGRR